MGLFDFFKPKKFDYLEAQGGVTNKYKSLIERLENLSIYHQEFDYSNDGTPIVSRHDYKSFKSSVNEYTVEIFFKRPQFVFVNLDTFRIIDDNDSFTIEYNRVSKNIMPMFPKLLPEKVKSKYKFSYSSNQDEIFKELLRKINSTFSKHNYVDPDFKDIYQN